MFYQNAHQIFLTPGRHCEEDITECQPNPCAFGGACREPAPAIYECTCEPGVEDSNCGTVRTASLTGSKGLEMPSINSLINSIIIPQTQTVSASSSPTASSSSPSPVRSRRSTYTDILDDRNPIRLDGNNHDIVAYLLDNLNSEPDCEKGGAEMASISHRVTQKSKRKREATSHNIKRFKRQVDTSSDSTSNGLKELSFTFTSTVLKGILLLATGVSGILLFS